jgi:N-acetylmuramoyl-L-alanine amidase
MSLLKGGETALKKVKTIALLVIAIFISMTILSEGTPYLTSSSPDLKLGDNSREINEMQQRLKNWGYYTGYADGNYSWETFLAVWNFQKKSGLQTSGIADKDTLIKMGMTRVAQTGYAYAEDGGAGSEQLLARAINGEARGEPYEGQVAVGAVIINRTKNPAFPQTIPGVIYQPGAFTAVVDGQINIPLDANSTVVRAARDALNGWDPTYGCIYYWNPATATSTWIWSRQVLAKIGNHYFGK